MSSLFGLLGLGTSAIRAQQAGIATSGSNAANVNSVGYSRQQVDLHANRSLVGGGAKATSHRIASDLVSERQREASTHFGASSAKADALLDLEGRLTAGSSDLTQLSANFFASLTQLSTTPTDPNLRAVAVASAGDLAAGFNRQARILKDVQGESNQRIRDSLPEINRDLKEIAEINRSLAAQDDPTLRDRRDSAALRLAEAVGARARIDSDGMMRLSLSNGETLVDGIKAAQLVGVADSAVGGMDRIDLVEGSYRRNITNDLTEGRVGGELKVRDETLANSRRSLDSLAENFASVANSVHQSFQSSDGVTGKNLFTFASGPGSAASFQLNQEIADNPKLLATSAIGSGPGDNRGILALAGLRNTVLASGQTLGEDTLTIYSELGHAASTSSNDADLARAELDNLAGLRDSISGVSLQDEFAALTAFEHAANAAAKFISTVDDLLGNLINSL